MKRERDEPAARPGFGAEHSTRDAVLATGASTNNGINASMGESAYFAEGAPEAWVHLQPVCKAIEEGRLADAEAALQTCAGSAATSLQMSVRILQAQEADAWSELFRGAAQKTKVAGPGSSSLEPLSIKQITTSFRRLAAFVHPDKSHLHCADVVFRTLKRGRDHLLRLIGRPEAVDQGRAKQQHSQSFAGDERAGARDRRRGEGLGAWESRWHDEGDEGSAAGHGASSSDSDSPRWSGQPRYARRMMPLLCVGMFGRHSWKKMDSSTAFVYLLYFWCRPMKESRKPPEEEADAVFLGDLSVEALHKEVVTRQRAVFKGAKDANGQEIPGQALAIRLRRARTMLARRLAEIEGGGDGISGGFL